MNKIYFIFTYSLYKYRKILTLNKVIDDYRFVSTHEKFQKPFDKSSRIICKDKYNNEIIITSNRYDNLKYIALAENIEKGSTIPISTIKRFCLLPSEVNSIFFDVFPWESVTKKPILVDPKNPYIV